MSPCLPPHNMPPIEHIKEYSTLSKKKEEVEKTSLSCMHGIYTNLTVHMNKQLLTGQLSQIYTYYLCDDYLFNNRSALTRPMA